MTIEEFATEKKNLVEEMIKNKEKQGNQVSIEDYKTEMRNLVSMFLNDVDGLEYKLELKAINTNIVTISEQTLNYGKLKNGLLLLSPVVDDPSMDINYQALADGLKQYIENNKIDTEVLILPPNMLVIKAIPHGTLKEEDDTYFDLNHTHTKEILKHNYYTYGYGLPEILADGFNVKISDESQWKSYKE